MSKTAVPPSLDPREKGRYMQLLLRDFHALEALLEKDRLERDTRRIGSELELNFLDSGNEPAAVGKAVRDELADPRFTTEFSRFNLEINSTPRPLAGDCFSSLERSLAQSLSRVSRTARARDCRVLLAGIIPTLNKSHITPEALTPEPRYQALYDLRRALKGEQYEYHIRGVDELLTRDNIALFAGCVTSFQVHLQIDATDVVDNYNWAQLIAGPVLASATYSPIFLGKRLWHETRIALFEQGADTRNPDTQLLRRRPRVFFGDQWLRESVLELLQEDIAGFEPLFPMEDAEDPWAALERGEAPRFEAWNAFNSSIYRWNRVCYGRLDDRPALRIENRILPSGPTVLDMVANAAFWIGTMAGLPERYRALDQKLPFAEAKDNFLKAARLGLEVTFNWPDGRSYSAQELIMDELLPIAAEGLRSSGVNDAEASRYLGIIKARVRSGTTGSRWMLDSYTRLLETAKRDEALVAVTSGMLTRQESGSPVHTWEPVSLDEAGDWTSRFDPVRKFMSTSLYKVGVDDVVDLVAHIMEWKSIGHIPVEDESGRLAGMITKDAIITFMTRSRDRDEPARVGDLMVQDPLTIAPDTPFKLALQLILENEISCLPVVEDDRIVGLVTERDFVAAAQELLAEIASNTETP